MSEMGTAPAHAKPKDHLWVLAVIAAACLIKVWPSWVGIGAEAGFPKIIKMPTDWTLAVVVEAYWAYAVYAWLAASAGRRSRKFAMWSAGGVFLLSLTAQSSASLMSAKAAGVFANAMPVTILALVAVLVHLRHLDRAEADHAEEKHQAAMRAAAEDAAAADERTALRAELEAFRAARDTELEAFRAELEAAQIAHGEARRQADGAEAKAEVLAQKLARISGRKPTRKSPPKKTPASTPEVQVPEDVDTQAAALEILAQEPHISGSALGRRLGKSERYGCMLKNQLTGSIAGPDSGGA